VGSTEPQRRWRHPFDPLPNPEFCYQNNTIDRQWHFLAKFYRPDVEVAVTLNDMKNEADKKFWNSVGKAREKLNVVLS
jgi:hypothetical protein